MFSILSIFGVCIRTIQNQSAHKSSINIFKLIINFTLASKNIACQCKIRSDVSEPSTKPEEIKVTKHIVHLLKNKIRSMFFITQTVKLFNIFQANGICQAVNGIFYQVSTLGNINSASK